MECLEPVEGGVRIPVRVVPRARKTELAGLHDGALRIRLQAPPVDGKANKALLKFLAGKLGVSPSDLRVVAGQRSRCKMVFASGLSVDTVRAALPGT